MISTQLESKNPQHAQLPRASSQELNCIRTSSSIPEDKSPFASFMPSQVDFLVFSLLSKVALALVNNEVYSKQQEFSSHPLMSACQDDSPTLFPDIRPPQI